MVNPEYWQNVRATLLSVCQIDQVFAIGFFYTMLLAKKQTVFSHTLLGYQRGDGKLITYFSQCLRAYRKSGNQRIRENLITYCVFDFLLAVYTYKLTET